MNINRRTIMACIALYEERHTDVRNLLEEMGKESIDDSIKPLLICLNAATQPDIKIQIDQLTQINQSLNLQNPIASLIESSLNLALAKQDQVERRSRWMRFEKYLKRHAK